MILSLFSRYLLRLFGFYLVGVLATLAAVVTLFAVIAEADRVLAGATSIWSALLAYAGLRLPGVISLLIPLAALVAALAALARLASGSELVAIRAAGVSSFRIAATLLAGAAVLAATHFWFANTVVPESAARLRLWQAQDYAGHPPAAIPRNAPHWFAVGDTIVHIEASSIDGTRLNRPTLIERDGAGRLKQYLTARVARYEDGQWVFVDVRRPLANDSLGEVDRLVFDLPLNPDRFSALGGGPEEVEFGQLLELANAGELSRRSPNYYAFWLQRRIAQPAASLVMVLIVVPVSLLAGRRSRVLAGSLAALGAGLLYFIAERLLIPLGENGLLPVEIAVWTPAATYALMTLWLLLMKES